ncbi:DUF4395 domain-containing protein [Streptomyces sp. NPDC047706]|uniref:DUF4395 domain-containing protein n=1 Tax=Streptomyces sp. NPDC047706 TaxID=3365486 RepID=UPI003721B302
MDIDVRGPRFGAAVTAAVLAVVLITGNVWLLAWQTLVFALGAAGGVGHSPYGWAFHRFVRPRVGPVTGPKGLEPSRFAQAVGLVFAGVGLVGYTLGPLWLGLLATGTVLAGASLHAVSGWCVACEMYLLAQQVALRVE